MSTLLAAYLWTNAVLYAAFGLMCLFRPLKTAKALGFEVLAPHGTVEYVTVYGGMQVGFAAFFALGASRGMDGAMWTLWFALCLYAPIVLVRWTALLAVPGSKPGLAWGLAGLEALLLAAGVLLAVQAQSPAAG